MPGQVPLWLVEAVSAFGVEAKEQLAGPGDREAAIRPPIEALLKRTGPQFGFAVATYGETQLRDAQVRPDYAVGVNGAVAGYIEVKQPGTNLEPKSFTKRNKTQWEKLKDLPNLLYTDGEVWRLYRGGELAREPVRLSGSVDRTGKYLTAGPEFEELLRDFLGWAPAPVVSVGDLVNRIAPLCRLLRASVLDQLVAEQAAIRGGAEEQEQPFTGLARDWRNLLFPTADDKTFADGYAQAVTFALLLARTENIPIDASALHAVGDRLGADHSLMGKALQLLTDSVTARFRVTIDLLVRVVNAVDWGPIRAGRADAYLHLYENFLAVYDDELRRASGSYYTPREVVTEMVRLTEEVLRTRLGVDGFLSDNVVTVDPAMGTGTFLHAIIERVAAQVGAADGVGMVPGAIGRLARRLIGFEMQMGPFAVAELRASDLMKRHRASAPPDGLRLFVTDTLDDPAIEQTQLGQSFEPIARSRRRANKIKSNTPVTVVIGNPPYRERAEGRGGWIENGSRGDDLWAPLQDFRLPGNGRLEYVLKNLYVYFWRWATWKVFDAHAGDRQGVVAFITTSGYLGGPGFKGMRRYLRATCDEGWIINVSPEGQRPDVPTRVFPGVQQPLAIGIFVRRTTTDAMRPAVIHYMEVTGRREDKYRQLADLTLDGENWREARSNWDAPFSPAARSTWDDHPALGDLMPWHAPGVKPNRTWVYGPHPSVLRERWAVLIGEENPGKKRILFKESSDRKIDTEVEPLPQMPPHNGSLLTETCECPAPVQVGYRSFDRQWLIPDNRLLHRPSPDLWRSRIGGQVYLIEQHAQPIASGPGIVATGLLPDMHHFNGRGGRVLPMLHPDGSPNISPGLLDLLAGRLGFEQLSASDLVAYLAGVLGHPGFTKRFTDELVTPGVRVPLCADADLWNEAVDLGRTVVWAATYGEAFADPDCGRPAGDIAYLPGDTRRPKMLTPIGTALPETIRYVPDTQTLHLGAGSIAPVPASVWAYDVGGMKIVDHWFDYRKAKPGGRKSSPLDEVHADTWQHEWSIELLQLLTVLRRLTELEPAQDALLNRVLTRPLVTVADLTAANILPIHPKDRKVRRNVTSVAPYQESMFG